MARPGVTYFEVAKAASQLHADNQVPTIDRVRQILGSGSNSTIATHLKQWKAEHMPFASDVPKSTVPPLLLAQIQSLWDSLQKTSQAEWDQEREGYQLQLVKAQQGQAQLTQTLEETQKESREQHQKNEALNQQLNQLIEQHEDLTKKHEQLEIRFQEQQNRLDEKNSHVQDLNIQLKHVSNNLDHFREAAKQQREEDALKHESEIHNLRHEIRELNRHLAEEKDRRNAVAVQGEIMEVKYQQTLEDNTWLTQQLDERTQLVSDLKSQIKALEVQRDDNSGRHHILIEKTDRHQNRIIELEKHLATATEKVKHLMETHTLLQDTIEQLQHEQVYLEGENRRLQDTIKTLEQGLAAKMKK